MCEYEKNLTAYQTMMALARRMCSEGIITAKEYAKIDTIIARKYGISSGSIFR
nr:MAG TPA: Short C-terminal domain [Caudoviricetes sp.]